MGTRDLKKRLMGLLAQEDIQDVLPEIQAIDPKDIIIPLFSLLLSTNPLVKWHTVTAFGLAVDKIAREDMESARVIVRRLMWQLNDESGGIGWGCPEAMGDSLARNRNLGREYSAVLISYIMKDGNFLEYEPLQRGAVWAIGRLSETSPDLARPSIPHLLSFLQAQDPVVRGLSAWALGLVGAKEALPFLSSLQKDEARIVIYRELKLQHVKVGDLASEAIHTIA